MSELFQCSLLDNSVTGRVKLYETQSGLIAFRMPREAICNQEDLPELNHPGIYFLFGSERAENGRVVDVVYVGQADRRVNGQGLMQRLSEHRSDPRKAYFSFAIVITTDGASRWSPTVLCHLENTFYNIAKTARRFRVKNACEPHSGGLSHEEIQAWSRTVCLATKMLALLGRDFTIAEDSRIEIDQSDNRGGSQDFILKGRLFSAKGRHSMSGFVVLKGSTISPHVSEHANQWIVRRREENRRSLNLDFVLRESIAFSSPSAAASFVMGHQANGWSVWKTEDGASLRDVEQASNSERRPRMSTRSMRASAT